MKKPFGPKKSFGKPGGKPAGAGRRDRFDKPRGSDARREDGPRSDRPRSDRPRSDKPRGERPFGDKPHGDKPRSRSDRPYGDKPRGERSFGDKPRGERSFDKPRGDRPWSDKPKAAKPFADKPVREKPAFEKRRDPQGASPRISGPLLWGFHAVRAAWENPRRRIVRLLVTDAGLAGFKDTMAAADDKRPQPEIIDKGAFERMMPPGAVHQGIAAVVESLPTRDAHDLIAELGATEDATLIILDQVTDPHNVGAILRSAAAFGARGVILQDRHAPELSGVLAKTASGAADVIPVAVETNLSRAIELLQENGFHVVGLDEDGEPLAALKPQKRLALVLGAEGTGLRRNVAEHCDALVSLPTQGSIKSLNVSNAAAVALYATLTAASA